MSLMPTFVEACLTPLPLRPLGPPSQVEVKQFELMSDPMLILDLMRALTLIRILVLSVFSMMMLHELARARVPVLQLHAKNVWLNSRCVTDLESKHAVQHYLTKFRCQ